MAMTLSGMITSKDIIDAAGISRATLNNYIKFGILPRPVVGPPPAGERGVKQIGYFPEEVLSRLEHVKQLKSQGKSMEDIVAILVGAGRAEAQAAPTVQVENPPAARDAGKRESGAYSRISDKSLRVTICDIESPAYLINRNFEVEWINQQAEDIVFGKKVRGLVDIESRNIFRLFFERKPTVQIDDWAALLTLHLAVLQSSINDLVLSRLYRGITGQEAILLQDMLRSLSVKVVKGGAYHLPVTLSLARFVRKNFHVHTMNFREGTFFVYLPDDQANEDILDLLSHRELVINDLLRRRMPSLVSLCVLVADLQDSVRISAELLPAQYFELINGLWESVAPSFEAHKAICGKHVGDGLLYYFIDKPGDNYIINCINCAVELRENIKKFSKLWRGIKGWDNSLYLNTGINEGQEFFGTIHSANTVQFTALGDTINIAARLSEFAKNGEIWTTKNLVSKLSLEQRSQYCFGVRNKTRTGNGFIRDSFSRLSDLLTENNPHYGQLSSIGSLPITEIMDRVTSENA
jgi:class 3 adenylate cyclase/DNA-binding transcriptional MerR regulator